MTAVGGVVPKNWHTGSRKGTEGSCPERLPCRLSCHRLSCVIYDGSYHDIDSSEMVFKIAASLAFKKAMGEAMPILMEPVMNVSAQGAGRGSET